MIKPCIQAKLYNSFFWTIDQKMMNPDSMALAAIILLSGNF
jgi:hypothetical protein